MPDSLLSSRRVSRVSMDEVTESDSESAMPDSGRVSNLPDSARSLTDGRRKLEAEPLDEDTYGAGIAALVRDVHRLESGTAKRPDVRYCRIFATMVLLFFTMFLQIWLMWEFKHFVTAYSVHSIRNVYADYEKIMYREVDSQGNGASGFNATHFEQLPESDKLKVCMIPFSQPKLMMPILLIWAMTVVAHLRRILDLFIKLIVVTETVRSGGDSLEFHEDDTNETGEATITGLTCWMKFLIGALVLFPRFIITCILLWLGSRWLAATASFGDLILNAMALEFILMLKDILYNGTMPKRNRIEAANTMLLPWYKEEGVSFFTYIGGFGLIFASMIWTYCYMYYWQQVLPGYRFDVHTPCMDYVASITKV